MFIPIGADCGTAFFLRLIDKRSCSLPLDWLVSYSGVSDAFENDFADFLPAESENLNKYNMLFLHGVDPDKFKVRIDRLFDIMNKSEEKIVFIRKGHHADHHTESKSCINDITDSEKLAEILHRKYPRLDFSIEVFLMCSSCFVENQEYTTTSPDVKVYNTSCVMTTGSEILESRTFRDKFRELH